MTIDKDQVPGVSHPKTRRARMLPTEPMDWAWLATMCAVLVGLTVWVSMTDLQWLGSLIVLPVLLVTVVSMYQPVQGSINERLYQIPITVGKSLVLRVLKRGEVYRSEVSIKTENELKAQLVKEARRRGDTKVVQFTVADIPSSTIADFAVDEKDFKRLQRVFPLEVRGLKLSDEIDIGLPFHKKKQTYSMVFKADGIGLRDTSYAAQYYTMVRIAGLITKATALAGLSGLKVSMGVRNRPQDQWLIPEVGLEVSDPDVVMPEAILSEKPISEYTDDDRMDVALHELQNDFSELGVQSYSVDMMVVVTIDENEAMFRAFKKKSMTEEEFKRLPIAKIQREVLPTLNKIIGGGVELLDTHGAERYLRKARDVATLFEFYGDDQLTRVLEREREQPAELTGLNRALRHRYLPLSHIISDKNGVNVDNTYGTVLDFTSFPDGDDVKAHEMALLSDAESTWSSFSVIGQSVRSGLEYTATNIAADVIAEGKEKIGVAPGGPRSDRKAAESYERMEEMDRTGVNQNFVVRFATLDLSEDEREFNIGEDIDRFTSLGFGPVRVTQPSQQWSKFLTTVTLIDCE